MSIRKLVRVDKLYCIREKPDAYEVSTIKYSNVVEARIPKQAVKDSDLRHDTIGFVIIPQWLAENLGLKFEHLDNANDFPTEIQE